MFKFSWKTTLAGVSLMLTGVAQIAANNGDISLEAVTAIIAGIGMILGKDFNVSGGKTK